VLKEQTVFVVESFELN